MNLLVINCGSSSLKYQLVADKSWEALRAGKIERLRADGHRDAIAEVLRNVGGESIDAVGHRVVHGGERFTDSVIIDDEAVAAIEACIPLAPLHNPANLAAIEACRKALPDVPQVAVFDTAFHHTLPRRAKTYAIDVDVAKELGIRRYGFHGTSHAYVAEVASNAMKTPLTRLRMITCHLGNGASVCAIEYGHSVETSMGMTPLEGLVMGTRSGDLDPGVAILLQRRRGFSADELEDFLNRQSGLKGLSGVGNDMRDILERAADGDERARLALGVFAHRVRKYIGAYAATMGGVDVIVMTGGMGEKSAQVRRRILQRFEYLGLVLDEDANTQGDPSKCPQFISARHSRVQALAIATNEGRKIAQETAKVVAGKTAVNKAEAVPIAISARHVHLTTETLHKLFGPDAELTKYKDISQPGQFASNEKVSLIGPRARIDDVRILGPVRTKDQVEISRTDEFKLGVDAPVRDSGHTEGSAPIILEGPAGRVILPEGLICAWRHIHMTPEDAEAYGVENGDMVEVAVTGGERDLTFGDVRIRVSPKYRLEMHIDTDEANAAELSHAAEGELMSVTDGAATLKRRTPELGAATN